MIELWNIVLLEPMVNGLVIMSRALGGSFGMAIIALTIVINILILPLTVRQIRSTTRMQSMQPKLQEIQKKYAKDKRKLQQETMRLYREAGMNPVGCAFPMLIQFPIWIALYQSVMQTLATTPERLLELSQRLYTWPYVQQAIPQPKTFLWLNLAEPNFPLTLLIMATMWVTQKMSTVPSADPKQQQTQNMMQWMMPMMFGFIFIMFPSGLALYIVVMNIFRMAVQYYMVRGQRGLASLLPIPGRTAPPEPQGWAPPKQPKLKLKGWTPPAGPVKEGKTTDEEAGITNSEGEDSGYGSSRIKRKNRRRGH